MSITRVQGNSNTSSGAPTTLTITLSSGLTQGNLAIVGIVLGDNTLTITAPDSSWHQATYNQPAGTSAKIATAIYYLSVDAAHAGQTSWTWTINTGKNFTLLIEEWHATNGWQSSPLDQTANGDTSGSPTTATTIVSGTTATTTQAEELWVAALGYRGGAQTESGITSGFTKDFDVANGGNFTGSLLYDVASATGAAACQYTIGTAEFWAGCIATFKDQSGTIADHDLTWRGVISKTINKDLTWRAILANIADHDLTWRGLLGKPPTNKDLTWRGLVSSTIPHDLAWRGLLGKTINKDLRWRGNITGPPATFYASNVASSIGGLTLSDQMSTTQGGTETSFTVTAPSSGTNSYLELVSQGGTPGTTSSLPAPTGKGWSISLAGQTITAGFWHAAFTFAKSGTTMNGATLVVRFWRRTMDGHYYPIATNTLSSQTLSSTKTLFTYGAVSATLWQFIAGDTLYMDKFVFNGNTAWASDVITVYVSNNATMGVVNDGVIYCPVPITTPAGLSCLIGSASFSTDVGLPIKNESFTLADALDQRSVLTLTGEDVPGTALYTRGTPLMFSDSNRGLLYTGFVNSDKMTKLSAGGSPQLEHQLTFMDNHYLYDKRANTTDYLNWTAGDMVCDFIQQTLSAEGVTGDYALESDYTPTTFGQGTLTNTVATTTTSPFIYAPNTATPPVVSNTGDLELTRAGTVVTINEKTTSDFSSGTLTNMIASSNSLSPTTQSAVCVQAEMPASMGSLQNSCSVKIWSGSMSVGSNDTLNYDIWIASLSPSYSAAVDLLFSDGTLLSQQSPPSAYDQNGLLSGPSTPFVAGVGGSPSIPNEPPGAIDLTNFAKDRWYTRTVSLAGSSGKTISSVLITLSGTNTGPYTVYIKNCYLGSQSGSPFFSTSATQTQVNPPVVTQATGFIPSLVVASVVSVYNPAQASRVSPAYSIDAVKLVQSSSIAWTASLPVTTPTGGTPPVLQTGQTSTAQTPTAPVSLIQVSYDGMTWLSCINQGALPGLSAGANVAGTSLYLRECFQSGPYPTAIPSLLRVTITIRSAASATTTDVTAVYGNATQWNTGTEAGTAPNVNGQLTLGGTTSRNWSDNQITNQTFFSTSGVGVSQSASGSHYQISVPVSGGTYYFGESRFDFAGLVQDFTIECDVSGTANGGIGILYRTTGWCNFDANGGFLLALYPGQNIMRLLVSANSSTATSNGTFTVLANVTSLTINGGTTYHLKIVVAGSRHRIYFNNATNPSIDLHNPGTIAPGGVGFYTSGQITGGSTTTGTITNFTLTSALVGTWQSPAISLNSLGTTGNAQIAWTELLPSGASSATAIVETSLDGGTTWQQCFVNGGSIPQLPTGTNVAGKSLLVKIALFASAASLAPIIYGLSVRVCGNYGTVTGTRVSPALSLTPVGYVASSNVMWNANTPTGTSITVATSQDNSTWTNIGNNGAGAPAPYWTNQPSATQDLFSSNTSANYTNTSKSGGSTSVYVPRVLGGTLIIGGVGSGGSVASVTYDPTNSRIILSGGSSGLYLNNSINCLDVDLFCDMDESDAGGLAWREVDTGDYYELGVYDASSSSGFTNQLRLYKVSGGNRTLLGSASTITFTRGTFHRIRVTMQGSLIDVYFDGTCVQSYLDLAALGAGQVGLRNDGGTSRYYQLWVQPLGTNLSGQVLYTKTTLSTSDPAQMPQLFTLVAAVRGASIATGATIAQLHPVTTPFAQYFSQEMDTLVQASGDFYWYVDRWKKLRFGPRLARPGAFPVQSVYDPAESSGYLLYQTPQGVVVTSSADLYRNRQIVTDVTNLVSPPPEIKTADGSTTSWTMGYPLYSAPTITINGVGATVGVQGIDNNKQFYWQPGSPSISYDSTLPKLPAGAILSFTYVGQTTVNAIQDNTTSQATQAALEGNSGIVAEIESALNSTTRGMTTAQATTFAQGLLSRLGNNNAVELVGATRYAGLEPGTVIGAFVPEMSQWNVQLPIVKLTTQGFQRGDGSVGYFFVIDATTGPNLSRWTQVWRA